MNALGADGTGLSDAPPDGPAAFLASAVTASNARLRRHLDAVAPHTQPRWAGAALLLLAYVARVASLRAFHIVTYGLGIYLLNLFLGFITPAVDPELDAPTLPSRREDEFRPFVRRLPEFKAWWATVRATALAFCLTFVPAADVPVFWPILVLYFFVLAAVTLKRQVKHMLRHRYVPWDLGRKTRYGGGGGSGSGGRKSDK